LTGAFPKWMHFDHIDATMHHLALEMTVVRK